MSWEELASTKEFEDVLSGKEAAELLSSKKFENVYNSVQKVIFSRWVQTLPEEQDIREQLYLQIKGMNALMAELQHLVRRAKSTQERLERKGK